MIISVNEMLDANDEHQHAWVILPKKLSKELNINAVTHLTFDPSIRVIPKAAFREHSALQSVRIPSTMKKIGKEAFFECLNLSNVDFQDGSLQTIGESAFNGCVTLKEAILPDSMVVIGAAAFQWCDALIRVQLPRGLKVLEKATFRGCTKLTEIDLPDGLVKIEEKTFNECQFLRKVRIPHTVKVIGNSAFESCWSLIFVELPAGLRKIRRRTFAACDSLSGIVLPRCLEEIEYQAFMNCTYLLGVEIAKDSDMKIDPEAFSGCWALTNVCIPRTIEFVKSVSIFARCVANSFLPSSGPECFEPFARNHKLRGKDGHQHVQDRFAGLPIHTLCYHASVTRVDHLKQALDACNDLGSTRGGKDYLDMTPFHVFATSAIPRVDILECLLSKFPVGILTEEDIHGCTMMDYLLKSTTTRGLEMIQMLLRFVFAKWLLKWNKAVSLPMETREEEELQIVAMNLNLNDQIESLVECDDSAKGKRERVREILDTVGFGLQNELRTLLELASWKRRMLDAEAQNKSRSSGVDCESCRYQCGAEVVIENVTKYLWADDESKYHTALSVFPLCTLEKEDNWLNFNLMHSYPQMHSMG